MTIHVSISEKNLITRWILASLWSTGLLSVFEIESPVKYPKNFRWALVLHCYITRWCHNYFSFFLSLTNDTDLINKWHIVSHQQTKVRDDNDDYCICASLNLNQYSWVVKYSILDFFILKQWYFVTIIALTYCEKKLF